MGHLGEQWNGRKGAFLVGTGNSFVLIDAVDDAVSSDGPASPDEAAGLARNLCAHEELDGLLLLTRADAQLAMTVFNRDGSRPEACGNGLRCLAHYALRAGYVRGERFDVTTDSGVRTVRVDERGTIATCLGVPRVEPAETVDAAGASIEVVPVDVGNPHAVVFGAPPRGDELERFGAALNAHARFPAGVNLEVATPAGDGFVARVFERGVGETAACSTGAAAVFAAARARLGCGGRVRVRMPGGKLDVFLDGAAEARAPDEVWVAGEVHEL